MFPPGRVAYQAYRTPTLDPSGLTMPGQLFLSPQLKLDNSPLLLYCSARGNPPVESPELRCRGVSVGRTTKALWATSASKRGMDRRWRGADSCHSSRTDRQFRRVVQQ